MAEKIKRWYTKGLWTKAAVKKAVGKLITEEDYKNIVGEDYAE